MAKPRTREEIFSLIEVKDSKVKFQYKELEDLGAQFRWVEAEVNKYARDFPFMRGATVKDYYNYLDKLVDAHIEKKQRHLLQGSQATPEEFWKTAYDFDPLGTGTLAGDAHLTKLLSSERVPPIELGKVYGNTTIWLLPGPNSLPLSEIKIPRKYARFPAALTDSGAISYPDGHPSIDYETGGPMYQMVLDDQQEEEQRLRRFCPLGWIAQKRGEHNWDLTGHALVMDMDRGRDRHPWIVLASHWPNDDHPEDFTYEAEKRPRRDDDPVHGILLGDHTRTVVAKLIHVDEKSLTDEQKAMPFLKQFGPDFSFNLWRKGGERKVRESRQLRDFHPDLAHIMGWFWDDKEEDEVCYAENGTEFMRYKPSTYEYKYPYLDQVSVAGQNAMFGEVLQGRYPHPEPASLSKRMRSLDTQEEVPRCLQESTTAGY